MTAGAVLASGFGTGQVLWSIVWLAGFVLVAGLFLLLVADVLRSDLPGMGKAVWTLALLVLPLFGALLYLGLYGTEMSRRMEEGGRRRRIDPVGGSVDHERFRLAALHAAGAIDDAEYAAALARVEP